jgi:3-oxoacyl-[acyl-carrier protein] reductase
MDQQAGRVAIVTGGSKGIGYAIAEALVGRGMRVAIASRNEADVQKAAAKLNDGAGSEVSIGVPCDVRRYEECEQLVGETVRAFGRVDVLVNNAGIGRFANVAELSPDDWRAVIETNLNGVYYCTHAALPKLRAAGQSWIINIGSLAGKNAFPGGGAYNASKFGLIGFSEALMQEVRHDGVRVSYIMPGSVATEFSSPGQTGSAAEWKVQPEDIAQIVLDLLDTPARTLPSRIEVRPSRPPRK